MTESWFLGDGLGAGIDQVATKTQIFGPAWYKPPFQQIKTVVVPLIANDSCQLGWGHVETRLKLRGFNKVEDLFEFICRYVGYKSTAHGNIRLRLDIGIKPDGNLFTVYFGGGNGIATRAGDN